MNRYNAAVTLAPPVTLADSGISPDAHRALYRAIRLCRAFDQRLVAMFRSGQIKGTYFPAVGQEACDAVPVFLANEPDDIYLPSHRDLAAAITRGLPIRDLARTILSKLTSTGKGIANPTWWSDASRNYFVFSPCIANQYCVGVGAALAFKMRQQPQVALVFLGEGGSSKGPLYEAMNFAGIHRLPVIFVVQNNWWAESVPIHLQCAVEDLTLRAIGFNMPGIRLDGNDPAALIAPFREAIDRARTGEGPSFFQLDTYRWYGHSTSDPADYRDPAELAYWKSQDPVVRYADWLIRQEVFTADAIAALDAELEAHVLGEIEAVMAEAEPEGREYLEYIYCPDGPPPAPSQRRSTRLS
ncbi:MAG: 2-oxoisovalerate dehydrogenase subunit alpha [bacterium]|nr:2-oxoisovalerate dehydrogenase subunit alpha [bacterium]